MTQKLTQPASRQSALLPSGTRIFQVLDVQEVTAVQPDTAIKQFALTGKPKVQYCDVLIGGGGMGGIAAAIRAAQAGASVCLTEESDWLGGQSTAQGVSALDENHLVEISGATRMYQNWRNDIRAHYRQHPDISPQLAKDERLNPGDCWVSWLSFEPRVAHKELSSLLQPFIETKLLTTFCRTKIVDLKTVRGRVTAATLVNLDSGAFTEIRPRYCIDATELGDLLPLAAVDYVTGAESRQETKEPHAPAAANPENVQDFTYPFVIDYRPGTNNTIVKPPEFDRFADQGKFSLAGYKIFDRAGQNNSQLEPFWTYRRLIAANNFPGSDYRYDLSMINWDSNDLRGQNIIDQPLPQQAQRLALAKNLSLGFLYWLQTQVPRDDGGHGYPEFALRTDILGTSDGLAKYPYIRESRRIKAKHTIVEQDIAAIFNPGARSRLFADAVGIGLYPIDIHGEQDVPGAAQASKPFQLPLGALIQTQVRNLLPACKNIGTTHITNGAYRLHAVEWGIGEAAGTLAGYCLNNRTTPVKVLANKRRIREIQKLLLAQGAPIFWFNDVPTTHPQFAAIQFLAVTDVMPAAPDTLAFRPQEPITRAEAQTAFDKLVLLQRQAFQRHEHNENLIAVDTADNSEAPLMVADLNRRLLVHLFGKDFTSSEETLSRSEFAQWLYTVVSSKPFSDKL